METQNRTTTLASAFQNISLPNDNDTQQDVRTSFNSYLTIYSINLAHRFPDVNDLNVIDYHSVRSISEFSLVCSRIALETWLEVSQSRRVGSRLGRAA